MSEMDTVALILHRRSEQIARLQDFAAELIDTATNQSNPVWWKTVKRHQLIPVEDMWDVRRVVSRLSDEEVAGLSKFPPRLPAKARAVDLGLLSRQGGPVYLTPKVCAYLRGEYDVVGSAAA